MFRAWWPVIADVLHQPLDQIKGMTVEEFDDAVDYLKRQTEGGGSDGQG